MGERQSALEAMEKISSFWAGRRVLVTGATGLLGSWLVKDLLARGAGVVGLVMDEDPHCELFRSGDFRRMAIVNGRLEDLETLERAINIHETDTVFHLGAQTLVGAARRDPWATFESNIRGTYNLLEACRRLPGVVERVVVASSDKAYGENPALPYTETMPLRGRNPYEVSKSCADLLAQSYHHAYGLPVAVARCGNIYGGGDLNWSRIVPGTIRSLAHGQRPIIRSDGAYLRDYLYVKDAVTAYLALAENLRDKRVRGGGFNFSPEKPSAVTEIVKTIQKLMKETALKPDIRNEAKGEIRSQYLSSAKARRLLKWRPRHDLQSGLRETIGWYRKFFNGGPS